MILALMNVIKEIVILLEIVYKAFDRFCPKPRFFHALSQSL